MAWPRRSSVRSPAAAIKISGALRFTWTARRRTRLSVAVAGDYNGNGVVDAAHYVIWRNSLGSIGTAHRGGWEQQRFGRCRRFRYVAKRFWASGRQWRLPKSHNPTTYAPTCGRTSTSNPATSSITPTISMKVCAVILASAERQALDTCPRWSRGRRTYPRLR